MEELADKIRRKSSVLTTFNPFPLTQKCPTQEKDGNGSEKKSFEILRPYPSPAQDKRGKNNKLVK